MAWILPCGALLILAACSSGGGETGGTTSVASPFVGVFLDSPVQNLGYKATPSGLAGMTNGKGQFNYKSGDLITFNIFGRQVGDAVPAAAVITPLAVFNTSSLSDPRVVNLAQLLLTLAGGSPSGTNPIVLPTTAPAGLPPVLDFSDPNFDTSFPFALISEQDAAAHLQATFGFIGPLTVSPTSRYVVDQNGKPFLLVGDAAWSLLVALSTSDADLYLVNRKQLGFTTILVNLIEHEFAPNAPANFYGERPFTGQNFTTPNEAYFAHVDTVLQSAAAKGIVVLLAPLYLGIGCGSQGWCAEVQAASPADLMAWGRYVGARYRDFDNIIWVIGADTDPSPVRAQVQAMVDGILSTDPRHLFTAANAPEQMAVTPWPGALWLTVNNVYTYSKTLYQAVLGAYAINPTKPVFLLESAYENEHGVTLQELRAQSYWTVLSGGFGHVFGNCPIWGFFSVGPDFCGLGSVPEADWKVAINRQGSLNMKHFASLFASRRWHQLVPDQSIITAGSGTFGSSDFSTAACATDGSSIIAYLPSSRTVTINGACLSGSLMTAWWYNPTTGVASHIGTYSTTGTQNFTPPGSGDWVLVLDDSNAAFPPPGSQ
jgi:hypothetical protein